jgi:hypothetical protein
MQTPRLQALHEGTTLLAYHARVGDNLLRGGSHLTGRETEFTGLNLQTIRVCPMVHRAGLSPRLWERVHITQARW